MVLRLKKVRAEQKEDTLYLHQAPRSEWAPSLSPDCLKVETYLRMNNIPYEHVDCQTLAVSAGGQVPICKFKGKEIPYSNRLISDIAQLFNKDITELTPSQVAFEALIESQLHWVLIYIRATQANQLPPNDIFQGRWGQFFRPVANKIVVNKLKTKADHQGIGRQDAAAVIATGKKDLRAISEYLKTQGTYLGGDKPNELDATAFAHLSQFWYIPSDNELKTYIKEECPNLVEYLERMKNEFWQDWEEKCRKVAPPRQSKAKEEQAVSQQTVQENGTVEKTPVENENVVNGTSDKKPIENESVAVVNGSTENQAPITQKVETTQNESTVEIVCTNVDEEPNNATVPNGITQPEITVQ